MARVLVAYESKYGSTRGIAQAVANAIEEQGAEVVLARASEVHDVVRFDAVVVGAPMYLHRWMPAATELLRRLRNDLVRRPVALFAVGLSMLGGLPDDLGRARSYFDDSLREVREIHPVSTALFTGALRREKHPLLSRLWLKWRRAPDGDFRDWEAIRSWARSLEFERAMPPHRFVREAGSHAFT